MPLALMLQLVNKVAIYFTIYCNNIFRARWDL